MSQPSAAASPGPRDHELVATLVDLGHEVTSVLDLQDLLHKIPQLIARLIQFDAFAAYLLDVDRNELRIACGSPDSR